MTKNDIPRKENHELAEDLLARFPGADRAAILKSIVGWCFFQLKYGNKREEKAACDLLNEVQHIAIRDTPKSVMGNPITKNTPAPP